MKLTPIHTSMSYTARERSVSAYVLPRFKPSTSKASIR